MDEPGSAPLAGFTVASPSVSRLGATVVVVVAGEVVAAVTGYARSPCGEPPASGDTGGYGEARSSRARCAVFAARVAVVAAVVYGVASRSW